MSRTLIEIEISNNETGKVQIKISEEKVCHLLNFEMKIPDEDIPKVLNLIQKWRSEYFNTRLKDEIL